MASFFTRIAQPSLSLPSDPFQAFSRFLGVNFGDFCKAFNDPCWIGFGAIVSASTS